MTATQIRKPTPTTRGPAQLLLTRHWTAPAGSPRRATTADHGTRHASERSAVCRLR